MSQSQSHSVGAAAGAGGHPAAAAAAAASISMLYPQPPQQAAAAAAPPAANTAITAAVSPEAMTTTSTTTVQDTNSTWQLMTRTVAHYERLEQIGEGTYGQVYRAICRDTQQPVALKKMRLLSGRGYWGMPLQYVQLLYIYIFSFLVWCAG